MVGKVVKNIVQITRNPKKEILHPMVLGSRSPCRSFGGTIVLG